MFCALMAAKCRTANLVIGCVLFTYLSSCLLVTLSACALYLLHRAKRVGFGDQIMT